MAAEKPHADASHVATEAASGGMPQFEMSTWVGQFFWLIVTFGVMYFILSKFILPKIGQGLTDRGDRIADDLDEASRMQQQATQAQADYERALADAKAKAHNIAETTRKSVDEEISAEADASEDAFARKQADADARIHKIKTAALGKIDDVAADTVGEIIAKIAGVKSTTASVKAAITSVKG